MSSRSMSPMVLSQHVILKALRIGFQGFYYGYSNFWNLCKVQQVNILTMAFWDTL